MQTIFEKRLTASEKERHWVVLPSKVRNLFPPDEVVFKIKAGRKTETTRIDNQKRLFLGSIIMGDLDLDSPNAKIIVGLDEKGQFIVRKSEN